MTSRQVVTVIFSVLFVTSANAFAQVKSGLNEVSFSATVAGSKFEGGDTTTGATLTGSYGRFLNDTIEVGPQLIFFKSDQPFWTRQSMHETVFDTTSHMYTFGVSAGISIFWG